MGKKMIRVRFFKGDSHARADGVGAEDHRTYDYFLVEDDFEMKEDSFAVVNVNGVLKITKIDSVLKYSSKATRYVVATFSLSKHADAVKRQETIEELRLAIEERAHEAKRKAILREQAQSDEVLKGMLDELDKLEG